MDCLEDLQCGVPFEKDTTLFQRNDQAGGLMSLSSAGGYRQEVGG